MFLKTIPYYSLLVSFILSLTGNAEPSSGKRPPGTARMPGGEASPVSVTTTSSGLKRGTNSDLPENPEAFSEYESYWSPKNQSYYVGVEFSNSALSVFGAPAATFGYWGETFGIEFAFGYTKAADTYTETVTTTDTVQLNKQVN